MSSCPCHTPLVPCFAPHIERRCTRARRLRSARADWPSTLPSQTGVLLGHTQSRLSASAAWGEPPHECHLLFAVRNSVQQGCLQRLDTGSCELKPVAADVPWDLLSKSLQPHRGLSARQRTLRATPRTPRSSIQKRQALTGKPVGSQSQRSDGHAGDDSFASGEQACKMPSAMPTPAGELSPFRITPPSWWDSDSEHAGNESQDSERIEADMAARGEPVPPMPPGHLPRGVLHLRRALSHGSKSASWLRLHWPDYADYAPRSRTHVLRTRYGLMEDMFARPPAHFGAQRRSLDLPSFSLWVLTAP